MLATQAPLSQYFDTSGDPLDGGFLYFGTANQNPETNPIAVYWDSAGTQPAAQPVRTENGYTMRSGTPAPLYAATDYSLTVRDKASRLVAYFPSSVQFANDAANAALIAAFEADLASSADAAKGAALSGFASSLAYPAFTVGDAIRQMYGTQTFTYYVATSGSDSNAGTSGSPWRTLQKAFDYLASLGHVGGTRVINVAAGTYTGSAYWQTRSVNPVQVLGVSSWSPNPTVIMDGGGSTSTMLASREGAKLYVKDIWVKNTTDNVADAQEGSQLYVQDCWMTDAVGGSSGSCIYYANNSRGYVNGRSTVKNVAASDGVIQAYGGSIISIGQGGTGTSDSPAISGGTRLVHGQHNALIKVARAYLSGGTYALYAERDSEIDPQAGGIDSCTFGHFTISGGHILMPAAGSMPITNTTVARFSVASPGVADRPIQLDDTEWRMVGQFRNDGTTNQFAVTSVTGTTTQTDILAQCISLLDQDFNEAGRAFRIRLVATKTGTAGTFTIGCSGTVSGIVTSITSNAAANAGNFICDITVTALTRAVTAVNISRDRSLRFDAVAGADRVASDIASKQLNQAQDIKLHVTLGNAADSVAPTLVQVFQAGV